MRRDDGAREEQAMSQNITAEKIWNERDGYHYRVTANGRMIAICRSEYMDQDAEMIVSALESHSEPPACDVCGSIMVASRVCQCLNCGRKV